MYLYLLSIKHISALYTHSLAVSQSVLDVNGPCLPGFCGYTIKYQSDTKSGLVGCTCTGFSGSFGSGGPGIGQIVQPRPRPEPGGEVGKSANALEANNRANDKSITIARMFLTIISLN